MKERKKVNFTTMCCLVCLYVQLALKAARTVTEHEPHKLCMSLTLTTRLCVENVSFSRSMTPRNAPETRSSGGQRSRRCLVALDETSPDRPAGSTEMERMPILRFCEYKIARRLRSLLALNAARTITEHEPHKLCMSLSDW